MSSWRLAELLAQAGVLPSKGVSTRTAGRPSAGLAGIRKRHPLWADQLGEDTPLGAGSAQGYTFFRPLKELGTGLRWWPSSGVSDAFYPSTRCPWAGHT